MVIVLGGRGEARLVCLLFKARVSERPTSGRGSVVHSAIATR